MAHEIAAMERITVAQLEYIHELRGIDYPISGDETARQRSFTKRD